MKTTEPDDGYSRFVLQCAYNYFPDSGSFFPRSGGKRVNWSRHIVCGRFGPCSPLSLRILITVFTAAASSKSLNYHAPLPFPVCFGRCRPLAMTSTTRKFSTPSCLFAWDVRIICLLISFIPLDSISLALPVTGSCFMEPPRFREVTPLRVSAGLRSFPPLNWVHYVPRIVLTPYPASPVPSLFYLAFLRLLCPCSCN